jgi:hypothetical protein
MGAYDTFSNIWKDYFEPRNYEGLREVVTPDFRLSLPGAPGPLDIDGAIGAAQEWGDTFENFGDTSPATRQVLSHEETDDGLTATVRLRETFRHTGVLTAPSGEEIQPTGRTVTLDSEHKFRTTPDGKVGEWGVDYNPADLIKQLQ